MVSGREHWNQMTIHNLHKNNVLLEMHLDAALGKGVNGEVRLASEKER